MAQAIVPLKDLVSAKTRLSGLLRPAERRALAQAMAEDVLSVLSAHPDIDRVTLVSDDPGADLLASKYAVDFLDERILDGRGLNQILEKSCDRLCLGGEWPTLVLHGDLPLLSSDDITAVLREQDASAGLVVGCDRAFKGTNLLAFNVASRPPFHFGLDSCAKHRRAAEGAGIHVSILSRMGIGLDVDQPADVALLMCELREGRSGHTAELLLQTELGKRIDMLIPSLDIENDLAASGGKTL
ncbi:MAG: 2-phospho-L-lactate guanylyltransferase [Halioglobus sp.]